MWSYVSVAEGSKTLYYVILATGGPPYIIISGVLFYDLIVGIIVSCYMMT